MADELASDPVYVEACRQAAWADLPLSETARHWDAAERRFRWPEGWPEGVDPRAHVQARIDAARPANNDGATGPPPLWACQPVRSSPQGDAAMTPAETRNREHMERVRAVHRRSAYERVGRRVAYMEQLEAQARAGLRPALLAVQVEALRDLRELRDALWQEMVAAGQVPA